jgi:hypothetical protein
LLAGIACVQDALELAFELWVEEVALDDLQ